MDMRQFAEDLITMINLLPRQLLQSLGAKTLDGERAHYASVEHRLLKDIAGEFLLGGNVSHEAPSKGVARTGWIANLLKRQGWSTKGMAASSVGAFLKEDRRAVFTMFNHQC